MADDNNSVIDSEIAIARQRQRDSDSEVIVVLCLIKLREIDIYLQSEKIAEKAANLNEFIKSEFIKRIE